MRKLITLIAALVLIGTASAQVRGLEKYRKVNPERKLKYNKRIYYVEGRDTTHVYYMFFRPAGVAYLLREAERVLFLNGIDMGIDIDEMVEKVIYNDHVDINRDYKIDEGKTARIVISSEEPDISLFMIY